MNKSKNTNYKLSQKENTKQISPFVMFRKMAPLISDEKSHLIVAFVAILINSGLNLLAPFLIGYTIDTYIKVGEYSGVILFSGILLGVYLLALVANYIQVRTMGRVGQHLLFNLRNSIFEKLEELPVAFFNQNKTGDLISRINNDTDKLNQFFSQSLMQFIGNAFMIVGTGILIVILHPTLGLLALVPAALLLFFTQLVSPWIKRMNAINLKEVGGMSAEIQESLENFKVVVAFDRRDYFRKRFEEVNLLTYTSAVTSGIANSLFTPLYGLATNMAQLIVLAVGIYLIGTGNFTLGLLVSYLSYVGRFYDPLRQLASIWSTFQLALASWDRISDILSLDSNLDIIPESKTTKDRSLLSFVDVSFGYPDGRTVLKDINITLAAGKTYALVGPTGGGKTTTASLMSRLFDPTKGAVYLEGKDIRSYENSVRTGKIGFILQEPVLFSGTVRDNILYGNTALKDKTNAEIVQVLEETHLTALVTWFEKGLDTEVLGSGDEMSLGQKQLIAFIRAVLRKPDILILDEATANIDTITEQLLEDILEKLPKETTKVIIAHRLNTIKNADEIYFVNNQTVTKAGSFDHAMELLLHGKRES